MKDNLDLFRLITASVVRGLERFWELLAARAGQSSLSLLWSGVCFMLHKSSLETDPRVAGMARIQACHFDRQAGVLATLIAWPICTLAFCISAGQRRLLVVEHASYLL